ncbi:MAG: hypothetical protein JWM33_2429 [Caulobacteraceae bacterium]|nr:hypothetical protein [Caulobacteraceae bacterium]
MAVSTVSAVGAASQSQAAFGLSFQSMLQIILTQLTYQDPLKPLDNFQFVSQLGQFAQLQQTQSLSEQITSLIASQSASQATGLLGRTVDFQSSGAALTGTVSSIGFSSGQPSLTVKTQNGQTIANISLVDIIQVR